MKRLVALLLGTLMLTAMLFTSIVGSGCGSSDTPAQKIDKAIAKSGDIKSVHTDYDVRLDIKGDPNALGAELQGFLPLSLGISGSADVDNNSSKPKAKGTIKLDGLDKILQGVAGAEGGMDSQTMMGINAIGSMLADMEFVLLDEKAYIKLAGTWYQTDASTATDAANLSGAAVSAGDVDTACMQNAVKDTSRFGADKILSDIQDAGKDTVNGVSASHYKANINLDGALTAMANALRDCGDAEAAGSLEAGKSELGTMFKTKTVELWIDDDNNIVQVKLNIELDPSAISDLAGSLAGTGTTGGTSTTDDGLDSISFSIDLKMSNFNQTMDITKPAGNILNLEDLLGGSSGLGGILGGSTGASGLEGLGGTSTTGGTSTGSSTSTQSSTSSYSQ